MRRPVARLLLVVNLAIVLPCLAVGTVLGYVGLGFTGSTLMGLICGASVATAAALIWWSVGCIRAYDSRLAVRIAAVSVPVYLILIYLNFGAGWEGHVERKLARSFVAGDPAKAAEARSALRDLRVRSGPRPAARELAAALETVRDPGKLRAIVELLGVISTHDSVVVSALIPFARQRTDNAMRKIAFASLGRMAPAAVAITDARYVAFTPDGLVAFALPSPHRLYGDSISITVSGLVLPRPGSQNQCEASVAVRTAALLAEALGGAKHINLEEMYVTPDGGLGAAVSADGNWLQVQLWKKVPSTDLGSTPRYVAANFDWCAWASGAM